MDENKMTEYKGVSTLDEVKQATGDSRKQLELGYKFIKIFGFLAVLLYVTAIYLYFEFIYDKTTEIKGDWGTFGDFLGGALNPLFSLFAFLALIYTIKLQSIELRNSAEQLEKSAAALELQNAHWEKQNFESTFFNLLNNYHKQREGLIVKDQGEDRSSFPHLKDFVNKIKSVANEIPEEELELIVDRSGFKDRFGKLIEEFSGREGNYLLMHCNNVGVISTFIEKSTLTKNDKKFYFDMLKLQMDPTELAYIFLYFAWRKREYFETMARYRFFHMIRFTLGRTCNMQKILNRLLEKG